jgi:hypothetical protein
LRRLLHFMTAGMLGRPHRRFRRHACCIAFRFSHIGCRVHVHAFLFTLTTAATATAAAPAALLAITRRFLLGRCRAARQGCLCLCDVGGLRFSLAQRIGVLRLLTASLATFDAIWTFTALVTFTTFLPLGACTGFRGVDALHCAVLTAFRAVIAVTAVTVTVVALAAFTRFASFATFAVIASIAAVPTIATAARVTLFTPRLLALATAGRRAFAARDRIARRAAAAAVAVAFITALAAAFRAAFATLARRACGFFRRCGRFRRRCRLHAEQTL